jgi:hypothetical protein
MENVIDTESSLWKKASSYKECNKKKNWWTPKINIQKKYPKFQTKFQSSKVTA